MAKYVCCPSCGLANLPERTTCKQCQAPLYATPVKSFADLIELRQLEFLVDTTADWPLDAAYRAPYTACRESHSHPLHRNTIAGAFPHAYSA
jgi:hypothetical protein